MDFSDPKFQEQIKAAKEASEKLDDLRLWATKCHLQVEQALDRFLEKSFSHPMDILTPGRFAFTPRLHIAQAVSHDEHDADTWKVIAALTTVRNKAAHEAELIKVEEAVAKLRRTYAVVSTPERAKEIEEMEDEEVVKEACWECTGFLVVLGDDAASRKQHMATWENKRKTKSKLSSLFKKA